MLLIDKVANRVVRQNADEVQGSLALPISIIQHYSNPVQISVSKAACCVFLNIPDKHSIDAHGAAHGKSTADCSRLRPQGNCTDLFRSTSVSGVVHDINPF